jgi:hypothetical protein
MSHVATKIENIIKVGTLQFAKAPFCETYQKWHFPIGLVPFLCVSIFILRNLRF